MIAIQIKGRKEIESIIFEPRTALISITDYNYEYAELKNNPNYLLQIAFDDVSIDDFDNPTESELEKYHMLTDEQAKQIAEFYHYVYDKVDILICQCEHGQSRSAAIASAFLEYQSGKGIDIFVDDRYYPNKIVFRKVFEQLKRKGIENGLI